MELMIFNTADECKALDTGTLLRQVLNWSRMCLKLTGQLCDTDTKSPDFRKTLNMLIEAQRNLKILIDVYTNLYERRN